MNKKHEEILLACSRDEWNQWRRENKHEQPNLAQSVLKGKNFDGFNFKGAGFYQTDFTGSTFVGTNFRQARLVQTNFTDCNLNGCSVYGISAWDLVLDGATQNDLVITQPTEPEITVDSLQIAQFLHLMINNRNIREAIDTITSKAVLILGNFAPDRLKILGLVKDKLRACGQVPILFNFEAPTKTDLTETVVTLANLSKIVIADLTEPRSVPHELTSLRAASIRSTVVAPICQKGHKPYAMFRDIAREVNFLDLRQYQSEACIDALVYEILKEGQERFKALLKARQEEE